MDTIFTFLSEHQAFFLGIGLLIVNLLFLVATVLQLPGNWLMVLAAGGLVLWGPEPAMFSAWTLGALALIALLAEIIEFASGSAGSRISGGTRTGAFWALGGGFAGGVLGTFFIPVPIVGSILGACAGAFLGALLGERNTGRSMKESIRSGGGAAAGRFFGIIGKIGSGVLIWFIAAAAAFVP